MSARDEILRRLKEAAPDGVSPRPERPPLPGLELSREELVQKFTEALVEETGIVHRVKNNPEALDQLAQIVREEGLKRVIASTDEVLAPLDLKTWGKKYGLEVLTAADFPDRDSYKEGVFDRAQAGITGVDFAIAESGTLGLIHRQDQPRLISLAPILHIAILPVERIFPVYEMATEKVFGDKTYLPSQFIFITGPSMTADIQGVIFKGMHGPRRLIAIVVG